MRIVLKLSILGLWCALTAGCGPGLDGSIELRKACVAACGSQSRSTALSIENECSCGAP